MSTVKQRSGELWVLRQARRLGLGKNPLRRRSDRIEALLLWGGLVVALLLIPVSAAVGTSVRNASEESAARQRAVLHEVQATTLESTEHVVPSAPGDALAAVAVRYVDMNGVTREDRTSVVMGTKAGAPLTIWIDSSGDIAPSPRLPADSAAFGAVTGFLMLILSWLLVWASVQLAQIPLNRRRSRDWDAEWLAVSPRWLHGQK